MESLLRAVQWRRDAGRRPIRTTASALARHFADIASIRVAIENDTHSIWINEQLRGYGHEVIVANDQQGLCGYEIRNRNFTAFSKGGEKGLWLSHERNDDWFCVKAPLTR